MAWNRTKIVCTLGPATDAPGVLEELVRSGMSVTRVNLSHGERGEHERRIAEVHETARRLGEPIAVLADLPGLKFRFGILPEGMRRLADGAQVILAPRPGPAPVLPVRSPEVLAAQGTAGHGQRRDLRTQHGHADRGREHELGSTSKCGKPRLIRKPSTATPAVRMKDAPGKPAKS